MKKKIILIIEKDLNGIYSVVSNIKKSSKVYSTDLKKAIVDHAVQVESFVKNEEAKLEAEMKTIWYKFLKFLGIK